VSKKSKKVSVRGRIAAWRQGRSKGADGARRSALIAAVKIALVVGLLAGAGAGLRYAEIYVKSTQPVVEGSVELLDVPSWVNWDLKERVIEAIGGNSLPIKDETADVVARNLEPIPWLADVHVDVTQNSVQVKARWRRPVAVLERGSRKFYVDEKLVVLDYMPMSHLPIVQVEGVRMGFPPIPGQVLDCNELAAAVALINLLHRTDSQFNAQNPLLDHIARIDVTNYRGLKNRSEPHIVMQSKDGTEVLWGAELRERARYLEAKDDEKLAKLYAYFHEHGSLGGDIKYIDLRNPQDRVPQPIDKYR
jgi:hypothetical protein